MALFSPAIESLRDLQRACALDKVRKRLDVSRASDRTLDTGTQINELTDVDRAANVRRDEIVDLNWKAKHRTRPDHPVRLICVAVKPHESSRGWKGPHCDGMLRLVTSRLDLPAEPIAEMGRWRWLIETPARGCPCPESRAMGASAATTHPPAADRCPAKRGGRAESGCHDGIRERPATGHGQPRAAHDANPPRPHPSPRTALGFRELSRPPF